jgi:N-hydroxyarylamine O-acetyltransferase
MKLEQDPAATDLIDLNAYFKRIHYEGDRTPTLTTLQAIQQQHTQTIAFENLNPLLKQPVQLDLASLQQKLIHQERGGYCFEHNILLRSVLIALGFQVKNLAARVRWNVPEGTITPRSHMLLRVDIDAASYITDVGFGGLTLTAPLALVPNLEQKTSHEPLRLILADDIYTLQVYIGQQWKSLYYFDLQEQQLLDYEVSNWHVSTHPNSLFVNHLIAARPDSTCRYALHNHQLTIRYLDGRTDRRILSTAEELRTVLEDLFYLNLDAIANSDQALQQVFQQLK